MPVILRPLASLLVVLALTAPAAGAGHAPLTAARIESFLATLPGMRDIAERHEGSRLAVPRQEREGPEISRTPMSDGLAALRGTAAYGEVASLARDHGFADPADWAETGDRVMMAYLALEMAASAPEVSQQMRQALQQIDSNPDLSDEQKRMMRQSLQAMQQGLANIQAPPDDIAAVRALRPQVEAALTAR